MRAAMDSPTRAADLHRSVRGPRVKNKAAVSAGIKSKDITLTNMSDKELIIVVTFDPESLKLTKKNTGIGAETSGGAGPAALSVSASAGYEFQARGDSAKPQKMRVKPGAMSKVSVKAAAYISVVFYEDGLFKFAIENRLVEVGAAFTVRGDHLESEIPFKSMPNEPEL